MPVHLSVPSLAGDSDEILSDRPFKNLRGRVSRIAPSADNQGLLAVFANLDLASYAGQSPPIGSYLQGSFVLADRTQQTIPISAVSSEDGRDYVWQLTQTAIAYQQPDLAESGLNQANMTARVKRILVELGERHGDWVALKTPLPEKTILVKQSGSFLHEGDFVQVLLPLDTTE